MVAISSESPTDAANVPLCEWPILIYCLFAILLSVTYLLELNMIKRPEFLINKYSKEDNVTTCLAFCITGQLPDIQCGQVHDNSRQGNFHWYLAVTACHSVLQLHEAKLPVEIFDQRLTSLMLFRTDQY